MKKIIYIAILLIFANKVFSQGDFGNVSPTTSDFMKYGDIPVSLYTGKINKEIPIYNVKDSEYDFPISLIYTSDGFKPDKRSGELVLTGS